MRPSMTVSRRRFVSWLPLAVAGAVRSPWCFPADGARRRAARPSMLDGSFLGDGALMLDGSLMLDRVTAEDFSAGDRCRVHCGDGEALPLELVEVAKSRPDRGRPAELRSEPFSLLFRLAAPRAMPQGRYRLEHSRLGTLELFLVPVGPRVGEPLFEAVFN